MAERHYTLGDRSHQVTIIAPAGTLLDSDSEVEARVPAAIEAWPIAFQRPENLQGGGVQSSTRYTVNIGYRTDVVQAYQILEQCCTQRRFQIEAIVPTQRRDGLNMTCVTAG